MHKEILPPNTASLIRKLQQEPPDFLKEFYLSGGTALALHLGHRESEDLDFFTQDPFDPQKLQQQLQPFGDLETTELSTGTLNTFLNSVQLQFLAYPYRLLDPLTKWPPLKLSSVKDIACTKLQTIVSRGSKKDFIDLYCILDAYSLDELLSYMKEKYPESDYSHTHIMKSLVYFVDAAKQPMPRMHQDITWAQVQDRMKKEVKEITFT